MKTLWAKRKSIALWIAIVCFLLLFLPNTWLPQGAMLVIMILFAPAMFTVFWETDMDRRRSLKKSGYDEGYQDGFKAGQESK